MKEKILYISSIILSLFIGIIGTIFVIKYIPQSKEKIIEQVVKEVNVTETNTIKPSIDKVYNSVVIIETYKNNSKISTGSGFIYKVDEQYAYILTNHHVIESGNKFKTVNNNSQTVEATLLGSDEYTDVAVLRTEKSFAMQVAKIGDSTKLELGDTVFTVGTPINIEYQGTVTKGIVSGKNRTVSVKLNTGGNFMMELLQTNAAINPGNSGGPLVNIEGEVVGINNMKLVQDEIEGMGFAIPIEVATGLTERLEKGEKIVRPLLGVSLADIGNTFYLYQNGIILDGKVDSGSVIIDVDKNSTAEKIGLKKGDIIIEVDSIQVESTAHFRYRLYKHVVGDEITIKYYRDGNISEIKATLENSVK